MVNLKYVLGVVCMVLCTAQVLALPTPTDNTEKLIAKMNEDDDYRAMFAKSKVDEKVMATVSAVLEAIAGKEEKGKDTKGSAEIWKEHLDKLAKDFPNHEIIRDFGRNVSSNDDKAAGVIMGKFSDTKRKMTSEPVVMHAVKMVTYEDAEKRKKHFGGIIVLRENKKEEEKKVEAK